MTDANLECSGWNASGRFYSARTETHLEDDSSAFSFFTFPRGEHSDWYITANWNAINVYTISYLFFPAL